MSMTSDSPSTDYANMLSEMAVGCRLRLKRFGVSRVVGDAPKDEMAQAVGADPNEMSVAKKLLNTKAVRYKEVTKTLSQAGRQWKDNTLPWMEPGIRLCRREMVTDMRDAIVSLRAKLQGAVTSLEYEYPSLIEDQRRRLGDLFDAKDYPATLEGLFDINMEYPNLQPDPALIDIDARLYAQQSDMVKARFQTAVDMAEEAFAAELKELIATLCSRLDGLNDDTTKRFDDRSVGRIKQFFEQFGKLDIGSNRQLESLVEDAKLAITGIKPEWCMDNTDVRSMMRSKLGTVGDQLAELMVDKGRKFRW